MKVTIIVVKGEFAKSYKDQAKTSLLFLSFNKFMKI